jgi:hypothetical protein
MPPRAGRFVFVRVVSWIVLTHAKDDPRNHTKDELTHNKLTGPIAAHRVWRRVNRVGPILSQGESGKDPRNHTVTEIDWSASVLACSFWFALRAYSKRDAALQSNYFAK